MTFSNQFLVENSIPSEFIESLSLFHNYGQSPPLMPNEKQFFTIFNFAENIEKLFKSNNVMKTLSIGSFLKLLLIECNNLCAINPIDGDHEIAANSILRSFRALVDEHYNVQHTTSFYANQLSITPDHLNRTVRFKIGKTAKEYIQTRIITEAKRLLFFTDSTAKSIGYQLGFNEPANFSAFFKKNTGLSPSDFKKLEIMS